MSDSDPTWRTVAAPNVNQLTLLVVEDDQGLNLLIQKRLRRHGFHTAGAYSGGEALRHTLTIPDPLLLLDYRLPDMTARELVLELAGRQREVPFIVMTGNGDERIAVEMMKLGARDYLIKGDTFLELLLSVVGQAIERIVTERRLYQAERALREAEHRFSLLSQRAAVGIGLATLEGQTLIANAALLQLTGYTLDELGQLNLLQLSTDFAIRPALMQRLFAEGGLRQIDVSISRKDGALRQASFAYDLLESDGQTMLLVTAEDITERIAAQQRISHLNAVLNGIRRVNRLITEEADRDRLIHGACESLIQTFGYGDAWIACFDQHQQIVAAASAGMGRGQIDSDMLRERGMLPACAGQALEHTSMIVIRRPAHECGCCAFESGCTFDGRLVARLVYGGQLYGIMSVGLAPGFIEDQEDQSLFADVVRDLAFALHKIELEVERNRTEAELQISKEHLSRTLDELEQRVAERTHELSIANSELARTARVKDEFLANMSHELRTPLNAVLGRTEMFQEGHYGPLTRDQSTALQLIEESGRHLLDLINDVLDVSKIEAGRVELDLGPVPVGSLCEASVRLVSQQALKKGLRLTQHLDPNVSLIRGDGRRLKQILVNLLTNAVKFTPAGGEVGLEVVGDPEEGVARFSVWDTGIGIAPEHISRLFQPFIQLDSSLARAQEGTGLGLALVANLTQLHGGRVDVASSVGAGSRFVIILPWQPQAPQETPAPSPLEARAAPLVSPEGQLILLAEDNATSVDLITSYLETRGLRIVVAHNGVEAVQLTNELRPALVLMDMQMPLLDGLAAIRQIRAAPELHPIPIIALTALAMPGDRERCLEAGATNYLSKPISLRQLENIVTSLILT